MPESLSVYVALLVLLCIKHYFADGQFQTAWQALNKGHYGHPSGLLHASIHLVGSIVALAIWAFLPPPWSASASIKLVALVLGGEFLVHYHIDWFKARFIDRRGWQRQGMDSTGAEALNIYTPHFFQALIADQVLHMLTYVAMGAILVASIY